jgi:serine/threonine protein kinase
MGTVWEAVDDALHVPVALKEINISEEHSDTVRRELVARAMREARSAAKLRGHPHVVTVYDIVEAEGLPWIVMELVRGRSLAAVVREDGPLDSARGAEIGIAVLDALSFADSLGITHRDVKPANILLTESGVVKLTDFGIAAAQDATRITSDGQAPMTVAYTAPERIPERTSHGGERHLFVGSDALRSGRGTIPLPAERHTGDHLRGTGRQPTSSSTRTATRRDAASHAHEGSRRTGLGVAGTSKFGNNP